MFIILGDDWTSSQHMNVIMNLPDLGDKLTYLHTNAQTPYADGFLGYWRGNFISLYS